MDDFAVHSDREHARKSPSAASRWWECTASISMEEEFGIDSTSDAAEEGTAAHELLEKSWNKRRRPLHRLWRGKKMNKKWPVTSEMAEAVEVAYDYMVQLELDGYEVISERRVAIACTGEFGTIDITAWNPKTRHLICADYKHGSGVFVDVEKNKQLRLYALGVIDELAIRDQIERLTLVIVQPRMKEDPSEYEENLVSLMKFERRCKKKCDDIESGNVVFKASLKNCMWCKASHRCKAYSEFAMQSAMQDFDTITTEKVYSQKDPRVITDDEINQLMLNMDFIKSWISTISNYARELAELGKLKDFKVVQSTGNRKWLDVDKTAQELLKMGYDRSDIFTEKINGITHIEKLFFTRQDLESFMRKHTHKPPGQSQMVRKNDPRPSITPANHFDDFADI